MMLSFVRSSQVRIGAAVLVSAVVLAGVVGDRPAGAVDEGVPVVYVADGVGYADALVGAVLAASRNAPLVTVENPREGDSIPEATAAELERLSPGSIVIFGGPFAVSEKVADELQAYTSGSVTRLFGETRFGTAAAIAEALPDKVADADRLDGKDSRQFLSATDTAADADKLDGVDGSEYARRRWAVVAADGTLERGHGATSATRVPDSPAGDYKVSFDRDVSACAFVATIGTASAGSPETPSGQVVVAPLAGNPSGVFVDTKDSDGAEADRPFHLMVVC